jgi:stage IV sporulation protein B
MNMALKKIAYNKNRIRRDVLYIRTRTFKKINIAAMLMAIILLVSAAPAAGTTAGLDERKMVIPIGSTAGIKMFSDGVLIVGISKIMTEKGEVSPASDAGLKPGDLIVEINSEKITSTEDLREAMQNKSRMSVSIMRDGKRERVSVRPAISSADGTRKLGAWVRDSMAGIGTLTFYDPETKIFGALGHGINDVDTSALMPLAAGSLISSRVASVKRGEAGSPGELRGEFNVESEYGVLYANTDRGVFGKMDITAVKPVRGAMPVAFIHEVQEGKATILANVEGNAIEEFEIEIRKIYPNDDDSIRDMTIEVTDPRLLAKTGGFVQGMSGSPILQNGKVVGAVTHVLINEPTRGYGIFIQKMLETAYNYGG